MSLGKVGKIRTGPYGVFGGKSVSKSKFKNEFMRGGLTGKSGFPGIKKM